MFGLLKRSTSGLTAVDAVTRAARGEIVLVDIREPAEIAASGRAQGALAIPMAALAMRADPRSPECLPDLKQGKPVAVYCASGARSSMARSMLERMGHEAHNIGGLGHWAQAGGGIVRG